MADFFDDDRINYNTRGTLHMSKRKERDLMFNKGHVWDDRFDICFQKQLEQYSKIKFSGHFDKIKGESNRVFDAKKEITLESIKKSELVEIELDTVRQQDKEYQMLAKAVCRLPEREDGEQVVVVMDFLNADYILARTAWLNKATDNHEKGLDTTDIDWNTNINVGFYDKNDNIKYFPKKD